MEDLKKQIERFEKKSLIFGGKKNLVDILEWMAENKISKEDLNQAVTLAVAEAIKGIKLPPPVFNVTFDPSHFTSTPVEGKPGHTVVTLKPDVVMKIEETDEKISLIANVIFPPDPA